MTQEHHDHWATIFMIAGGVATAVALSRPCYPLLASASYFYIGAIINAIRATREQTK